MHAVFSLPSKFVLSCVVLFLTTVSAAEVALPECSWQDRALFVAGMTKTNDLRLGSYAANPTYQKYANLMDGYWRFETTNSLDKITALRKTELADVTPGQHVFYPLGGADLPNALTFFPTASHYTFIALEPVGAVPDINQGTIKNWVTGLEGIRQTFKAFCGLSYFESRMLRVSWSDDTVNGNLPLFLAFIVRMNGEVLSVSNFDLDASGKKVYSTTFGKPGVEIRFKKDNEIKSLEYHQIYLGDNLLTNNTPQGAWLKSLPKGITLLKSAVYLYFWPDEVLFKELTLEKSSLVLQDDSGIPFASFNNTNWTSSFYGSYIKPGPVGGIDRVPYQKDLEAAYSNKGAKPFNFNYGYGILWTPIRANMMIFRKK